MKNLITRMTSLLTLNAECEGDEVAFAEEVCVRDECFGRSFK